MAANQIGNPMRKNMLISNYKKIILLLIFSLTAPNNVVARGIVEIEGVITEFNPATRTITINSTEYYIMPGARLIFFNEKPATLNDISAGKQSLGLANSASGKRKDASITELWIER